MKRFALIFFIIVIISSIAPLAQGRYSLKQGDMSVIYSEGNLSTELEGDLLSMDIRDVALKEVLKQISRQHGIKFLLPSSLEEEKVMVRFSNLKIDEGLIKILNSYNTIFIYKENYKYPEAPITILTEVRIYPHLYKGKLEEPLMSISESHERKVEDTDKGAEKYLIKQMDGGKEKESVKPISLESLSLALKNKNPETRLKAVKALAGLGNIKAIEALSLALNDKDPKVKEEAVKAVKEMGKDLINGELSEYESQNAGDEEELPPEEGGENTLRLSGSGNGAKVELTNGVPVRAVQFTLNGAKPIELRTTSRTEGFFSKFDAKSGKVVLLSLSGNTIAPGTGPIAEIMYSGGGSASLSGIIIGTK